MSERDETLKLLTAARNADWMQVVLNQGPPCFHLTRERFCLRAQRWTGHGDDHVYVPLDALLATLTTALASAEQRAAQAEAKLAELWSLMPPPTKDRP